MADIKYLKQKSKEIRIETLLIHKRAMETRVASSLSCIEFMVCLYYGGILKFDPKNQYWEGRDRFIISKGHGSIAMFPILADVGYFEKSELERVCQSGSFLGGIPDPVIPGYETVNGSLGHGLGVSCGIAVGLKRKKSDASVFTILGDGELNEGSNWEAMMFADHHKLDNLTIVLDNNKVSMLDFSNKILDLESLVAKFKAFNFHVESIDGHDIGQIMDSLTRLKSTRNNQVKVLILNTIKGKGSPQLEMNSLSHVTSLKPTEIDSNIEALQKEPI